MKGALRIELKSLRKRMHSVFAKDASHKLEENILTFLSKRQYIEIAAFYPINDEIDITPTLLNLLKLGYKISLPQVLDSAKPLRFIYWSYGDKLKKNNFGIYEPISTLECKSPQLVFVPLLGFDKNGNRIGYGKGHYDLTLPLLPQAERVGVAYSFQEVDAIPTEPHDQKLHYVITEKEIIDCPVFA